jgi:hypothetical protein
MSEITPRGVGRPRKHLTVVDRVRAYRLAHGLRKVTVDVPSEFADELRKFSRQLRDQPPEELLAYKHVAALAWKEEAVLLANGYSLSITIRDPAGLIGAGLKQHLNEQGWDWYVWDPRYPSKEKFGTIVSSGKARDVEKAKAIAHLIILDCVARYFRQKAKREKK